MGIFSYNASDKRLDWERKCEVRLKNAVDRANNIFIPGPKLHFPSPAIQPSTLFRRFEHKHPIYTIALENKTHKSAIKRRRSCEPITALRLSLKYFLCRTLIG